VADELDIRSVYTEGDEREVELRIFLRPADESELTVPEVQERLRRVVPPIPGVTVHHGRRDRDDERAAASVVLHGDDAAVLAVLAAEVRKRLETIEGVVETESSLEHGDEEIRLRLDRDLLRAYGVGVQAVTGIVSTTLRGAPLPDYHVGGRQVPMRFRLSPRNRSTVHQLVATPVPAEGGGEIALGAVARVERARGLPVIMRRDGQTMLRVTARTAEKDVEELSRRIDAAMASVRLPDGYRWDKSDRFNVFEEGSGAEGFAVVMSACFIFILMGVLFESWLLPLSVMLSVPFAFVGVNLALVATATPRDVLAGIGSVLLVGLVVNNAIVLVDCVNRHRLAGLDREDAIRRALGERFRPIALTALTTLFGVLPMAIGGTEIVGIPFAPLGRVIFGGLLASTVSTVVVVPLFYVLFDDLAAWLAGFSAWTARALPALPPWRWLAARR
jgi:HAE1 family hydrophobic/amphiphilic exporter-1